MCCKRIPSLLLMLFIFITSADAQTGAQSGWEQLLGGQKNDVAKAIVATKDGGFAFLGDTESKSSGKIPAWVGKISATGQLEWENTFGGGKWDEATAIAPASDGGVVVAGKTWAKNNGRFDAWVFKVSRTGQVEWDQAFGSAKDDLAKAIVATKDGGFAFLGDTESKGSGKSTAWVGKISATGQLEWENTFGGGKWDEATAIAPTSDGGVVVAGKTWPKSGSSWDAWVFKLNRNGQVEWDQAFGGAKDDLAKAIVATKDGGFAFLGNTESKGSTKATAWVVKLAATGQIEWENAFGSDKWDEALSLATLPDGSLIVAGKTWTKGAGRWDGWVFKLSRTGQMEGEQALGGASDDLFVSVAASSSGSFTVAGYTESKGSGKKDAWICQMNRVDAAYTPAVVAMPQPAIRSQERNVQTIGPAAPSRTTGRSQTTTPAFQPQVVTPNVAETVYDVDKDIPSTGTKNQDAVAVIIGNRHYAKSDVPAVEYAQSDAQTIRQYLIKVLGYREGNILFYENASLADFNATFGKDKENFKGKLYNYVKPGKSDVFIYYSGHGAPDVNSKTGYFVPSDCDPSLVSQNGYPLETFYHNLSKIPAKSMTVVVDACFSGASGGGMVIKNASPLFVQVKNPMLALQNATVFTSSSGDQVSSWYPEARHSLFTYYFLKGMKGEADANKDGTLTAKEMEDYLNENVPYMARRLHGREQTPQIFGQGQKTIVKYIKMQDLN